MITVFTTLAFTVLVAVGLMALARKNVGVRVTRLLAIRNVSFATGRGMASLSSNALFLARQPIGITRATKGSVMHRVSLCLVAMGYLQFPNVSKGGLISGVLVETDVSSAGNTYSGIGNLAANGSGNIAIYGTNQSVQAAVSTYTTQGSQLNTLMDTVTVAYAIPSVFTANPGSISLVGESPAGDLIINTAQATPGWTQDLGGSGSQIVTYASSMAPSLSAFTLTYAYLCANAGVSTNSVAFGSVDQDSGTQSMGFSITNNAAGGPQAGLDLMSITPSGDTGVLSTDLASFSNLLPGQSMNFNAFFDASADMGSYSASYTLDFANYELPDVSIGSMTITVSGDLLCDGDGGGGNNPTMAPEPNSLILSGIGAIGALGCWWRRRRGFAAA